MGRVGCKCAQITGDSNGIFMLVFSVKLNRITFQSLQDDRSKVDVALKHILVTGATWPLNFFDTLHVSKSQSKIGPFRVPDAKIFPVVLKQRQLGSRSEVKEFVITCGSPSETLIGSNVRFIKAVK
jgi:hypothetical protein